MSLWLEKLKVLKENIRALIPYTLPLKLILGLFVTAIGSASVLGLLSEFAVYNYALVKGFRVPVEGIPYLRPIVTLISLCLLVFAALGFLLVFSFAKSTATYLAAPEQAIRFLAKKLKIENNHISKFSLTEGMRKSSKRKVLVLSTVSSLAVVGLMTLLAYYIYKTDNEEFMVISDNLDLENSYVFWLVAIFLSAFVMYISAFRPRYIKYMATASSIVSVCLLISFMFYGQMYSKFLNVIGFGGEREISLITKNETTPIVGKLLIQSNDYYFVLLDDGNVVEFPSKKVERVLYRQSESFWASLGN